MVSAWASHGRLVFQLVSYKWLFFYTKAYDDNFTVQNNEVIFTTQLMHISSAKDNKLVFRNMSCYRMFEDI